MERLAVALLALALLTAPLAAEAQQAVQVWRIGFLGPPQSTDLVRAFRHALRELGYVEGQNIVIEYRSTGGSLAELHSAELLSASASELVRSRVDVLVTSITQAALAAKGATTTIPIVMVNVGDPVESGLVASLARPGGNITGLSRLTPELVGKNLELLKEVVPQAVRVGVLSNPTNPLHSPMVRKVKQAAEALGLQPRIVGVRIPSELEAKFSLAARESVDVLLVLADGMFFLNRTQIADLARRHHLPAMFQNSEHIEAGGLMSYAPSTLDNYRRAAVYIDKILKGAKPADLPVEQPTKFELVINLKTAKALGLTIPPSVLARADELIQ